MTKQCAGEMQSGVRSLDILHNSFPCLCPCPKIKKDRASTKERPTNPKRNAEKGNFPWREVAKEEIEKYTEAGVMLKGCRYRAELTQKALAEALGISQHHISEMENGKRSIGKSMAKRLADFFKTDYRIFL